MKFPVLGYLIYWCFFLLTLVLAWVLPDLWSLFSIISFYCVIFLQMWYGRKVKHITLPKGAVIKGQIVLGMFGTLTLAGIFYNNFDSFLIVLWSTMIATIFIITISLCNYARAVRRGGILPGPSKTDIKL